MSNTQRPLNKDDPAADKVRIGEGLQQEMIVVVGITRVADIYLGEFMRLYSHHAFRESLSCSLRHTYSFVQLLAASTA